MSEHEELQLYVASIANDALNSAISLVTCAENIEKYKSSFSRLTATTQGSSAKTVENSFRAAQKQILIAANALIEAAKAGAAWSGESVPELKLTLKPRGR